jgi:hypothetical protein
MHFPAHSWLDLHTLYLGRGKFNIALTLARVTRVAQCYTNASRVSHISRSRRDECFSSFDRHSY